MKTIFVLGLLSQADIQDVKDAICSAVDVMQGMASSICSLVPKVVLLNFLNIFLVQSYLLQNSTSSFYLYFLRLMNYNIPHEVLRVELAVENLH